MARLPTAIVAGGLLRAAQAVGGNGMVLAKGDADAGALLVVLTCRGVDPIAFERVSSMTNGFTWNKVKGGETLDFQSVARFVAERKRFDRDLWALELDIPDVEQFVVDCLAET